MQTRELVRRGSVKGPVLRRGRFGAGEVYLLNLDIIIVFLGGVALCMLVYSWVSPYWFMIGKRAYTRSPELRVLGLTHLLEGNEAIGASWLWSKRSLRKRYALAQRRDRICNPRLDELGPEVEDADGSCDLDCQDIRLLGTLQVLCDSEGYQMAPLPIPIVPAPRLRMAFNESMQRENNDGVMDVFTLRYGCERPVLLNVWCPAGYEVCDESQWHRCKVGTRQWDEPACCMDRSMEEKWKGSVLFDQFRAPNYIHVFGWAQWQAKVLRNAETAEGSWDSSKTSWCTVRHFRCATLTEFASNGRWCFNWLSFAGVLMLAGLALKTSRLGRKAVSGVALLFALAGATTFYATWSYHARTAAALQWTTTPIDKWGRPYIHSMNRYNYNGRSIESMPEGDPTSPEWMYYHVNARVDYVTEDPEHPSGFTMLWGAYFGIAAGCVSLAVCLFCLEMQCALLGCRPLSKIWHAIIAAMLILPLKFKGFVDDSLAAYPVLWVYPWQKWYPKAFTCGSWLPFPFDQMYDLGLMLPVHCTRAIWDYVSCQDICSPAEKEVLHKRGVHNDRLCSLLCSRRSYFAMMAGLGAVRFAVSLTEVIGISDQLVHLRQASSRRSPYPQFRCNWAGGYCPADQPDPVSMGVYLRDMFINLCATIYEGTMNVETSKRLVEWLGGFVAISCAAGALANWTNFKVSRKFCLIGWIFMMLTPVITSSFAENDQVDWPRVEKQMVKVSAEVWEELMYVVSQQSCEQVVDTLEIAYTKGGTICTWVRLLKVLMPQGALQGCEWFNRYGRDRHEEVMANTTSLCRKVKAYTSNGHEAKRQCKEYVGQSTPEIVDGLKLVVGLQAGVSNKMKLMGAVMGMVPALMQGGLMIKNMMPRQTTPAILTTLPFAFTTLVWAQYQIYYQVLTSTMFLVAIFAMSFGPLVYYLFSKHYRVVQPMCDQQSVTLTFRIWWYAAICALITPYSLMLAYFVWVNDFQRDLIYTQTLGSMSVASVLSTIVGVLSAYAYSLQAGIDWFVDEIVHHHSTLHAPAVLAATISQQEAKALQRILGADLDLDSIDKGEYVCGGLGDPARLHPPDAGTWKEKAQIYACSLAYKDFATLDSFAGHIKGDPGLPAVLARARRPYYRMLNDPPEGAFNGREVIQREEPDSDPEESSDGSDDLGAQVSEVWNGSS